MKKLFGQIGLILSLFTLFSPIHTGKKSKDLKVLKTDKRIVAFDIHGVLCSLPRDRGWQCVPQEETFELVKELHAKGVELAIFSNISRKSYCKLVAIYPGYFKYFNQSRSLAEGSGITYRKGHSKYHKAFLKRNKDLKPQNITFFDDVPKYIRKARRNGINGYHYSSVQQARQILVKKGLL